jgi:DnaJ-class molecular chaperone
MYGIMYFLTEDFMARIKELWVDIQEMADNGYDAEDIALIMEIDIDNVKAALGQPVEGETNE